MKCDLATFAGRKPFQTPMGHAELPKKKASLHCDLEADCCPILLMPGCWRLIDGHWKFLLERHEKTCCFDWEIFPSL